MGEKVSKDEVLVIPPVVEDTIQLKDYYCLHFINKTDRLKVVRVWLPDGTTYGEAMEEGERRLTIDLLDCMFQVEKFYGL